VQEVTSSVQICTTPRRKQIPYLVCKVNNQQNGGTAVVVAYDTRQFPTFSTIVHAKCISCNVCLIIAFMLIHIIINSILLSLSLQFYGKQAPTTGIEDTENRFEITSKLVEKKQKNAQYS